jgi:predicted transcriptional regulator
VEALPHVPTALPDGNRGECIRLRLQGWGVRRIGRHIGISHVAVSKHLAHPEARRVLDEMGQAAAITARDIITEAAPDVARIAREVAQGKRTAIKMILALSGLEQTINLRVSGGVDIRHSGDDALRRRLVELRGDDDGEPADGG